MKHTIAILILLVVATGFTACDTNQARYESADASAHHHDGEHIYTCPMGCEGSTSNKPGKCPVCGMDLEHTDQPLGNKVYRVDFTSEPAQLETNKPATLRFTPRDADNDKVLVALDEVHEKKMHMIVVSKDLSYFDHVHPEYASDGSLKIEVIPTAQAFRGAAGADEMKLEHGGEYVFFLDYTPTGSTHQVARIPVSVLGSTKPPVRFTEQSLSWSGNGYNVMLSFDKNELRTNESVTLRTTINQNGTPVTNLENYLGALGHMVVISEDTEDYLHVHPEESRDNGPTVSFHSNFRKPGIYRVFLQFMHQRNVQTADFTIVVKQGDGKPATHVH